MLIATAAALFAPAWPGVIVRRNVLIMLMCMELMLSVNLSLVTFAQQTAPRPRARPLIFVVATN
jgi:NADH:ubiquinone oxidoreductase subunit K